MKRRVVLWVISSWLWGCTARVAGGLDEPRANEAIALLEEHGIAATKEQESGSGEALFAIEVPRGDLGGSLRLLRAASLPRQPDPGIAETYAEPSLVPSPTEDRARFFAAIAGELARTIERLDGVTSARVHVAAPDASQQLLDAAPPPARASVLVNAHAHAAIDTDAIRALVVGAVDGLVPSSVSVVVARPSRPSADRPRLAHVGPFRVAPGSAALLTLVLVASLGLHLATASALLVLLRKRPASS